MGDVQWPDVAAAAAFSVGLFVLGTLCLMGVRHAQQTGVFRAKRLHIRRDISPGLFQSKIRTAKFIAAIFIIAGAGGTVYLLVLTILAALQ